MTGEFSAGPGASPGGSLAVLARTSFRRRLADAVFRALPWVAVGLALLPLAQMTELVVRNALPALHWKILITVTQGIAGGLANAMAGSALLVGLGALFAVPIGVAGGLLVAEVRTGPLPAVVRASADVLAGVPSVAVGYFGFVALVQALGWGYSALAGAVALAIIMLPFVVRSTDFAVTGVPDEVRQASLALGADRTTTARRVVFRAALPGIVTGVLLGTGVAVGETAPLIYTASWSNFMPKAHLVHAPVGYLTYVVWTYINQPFASANALAYAAALLLMVAVLALDIVARLVTRRHAA